MKTMICAGAIVGMVLALISRASSEANGVITGVCLSIVALLVLTIVATITTKPPRRSRSPRITEVLPEVPSKRDTYTPSYVPRMQYTVTVYDTPVQF